MPAPILVREDALVGDVDERAIAKRRQAFAEARERPHVAEADDVAQVGLVQIRRSRFSAQRTGGRGQQRRLQIHLRMRKVGALPLEPRAQRCELRQVFLHLGERELLHEQCQRGIGVLRAVRKAARARQRGLGRRELTARRRAHDAHRRGSPLVVRHAELIGQRVTLGDGFIERGRVAQLHGVHRRAHVTAHAFRRVAELARQTPHTPCSAPAVRPDRRDPSTPTPRCEA